MTPNKKMKWIFCGRTWCIFNGCISIDAQEKLRKLHPKLNSCTNFMSFWYRWRQFSSFWNNKSKTYQFSSLVCNERTHFWKWCYQINTMTIRIHWRYLTRNFSRNHHWNMLFKIKLFIKFNLPSKKDECL